MQLLTLVETQSCRVRIVSFVRRMVHLNVLMKKLKLVTAWQQIFFRLQTDLLFNRIRVIKRWSFMLINQSVFS